MQGLHSSLILAVVLLWTAGAANAQLRAPEREISRQFHSENTYADDQILEILASAKSFGDGYEIHVPEASFIKIHFSQFRIPDGVLVEVSNRDFSETYRYSNKLRDSLTVSKEHGDDGKSSFSAMSITGDTALVRLSGELWRLNAALHQVQVDTFLDGSPLEDTSLSQSGIELSEDFGSAKTKFSCGADERYDAACFRDSHPAEYDRTIPVAVLITSRGEKCTAWRVGPDNRMFTARHCVSSQDDLDGSEVWFNYAAASCGSSELREEVKVTGQQLLASDNTLDYALFTVNNFSEIARFGYIGLDIGTAAVGEGIFIPQHGLARPRQLALESDMNVSGYCEVNDNDLDGYGSGSDLGYYCDTTTSSSGSPVISRVSGRAVALHHLGGCLNAGSKVSLIWPQVASHFNGVVPDGDIPWGNFEHENQAPIAVFSVGCDALTCQFDASDSVDADGMIVDYRWQLSNGEVASGPGFVHEFAQAGTYEVSLVVEDDEGASGSYASLVSPVSPNTKPVAVFSSSCIDNECTFDAHSSHDDDGVLVAWDWSLGDGSSASGERIDHKYSGAGSYSITLTVRDNQGATDGTSRTVTLNMPNAEPVARFDFSCLGLKCEVDAASSVDEDGEVISYAWDFGDGFTASGARSQHNYLKSGSYTIRLDIEDERGGRDSISHSVTVEAPNQGPVANFSYDCSELECSFDASASTDADGQLVEFGWQFGDGSPAANGLNLQHTYAEPGQFFVTLTVVDDQGLGSSRQRLISVSSLDAGPTAEFSFNCEERRCTFDAGSSFAINGALSAFTWTFGDGETAQGRTVDHTYAADGDYIVILRVMDSNQASGQTAQNIEISSRPEFVLEGNGSLQNGRILAVLNWSGAESDSVTVLRNGELIDSAVNSGKYFDGTITNFSKSAHYRLCETQSERCSNEIEVQFSRQ